MTEIGDAGSRFKAKLIWRFIFGRVPYAGPWMISLVHLIAITDVPGYDWQSYWGNLTFAVPAP